jgi:hypothetical protein
MKKLLPTACLFVVTISQLIMSSVYAQRETRQNVGLEKIDLSIVGKIRDEGLKRSHIPDDVRYLTDVIGPRLTGSRAMKRANEWTAQKMHEYGMENTHLEAYEFGRGWEEVSYFGRMTEPFVRPLNGRSLAWTGSTKGLQKGPAVIVTPEELKDPAKYGQRWKGAWILPWGPATPRDLSIAPPPLRMSLEELLAPPTPAQQTPSSPTEREDGTRTNVANFQRVLEIQNTLQDNGALGILILSRGRKDGIIRGTSFIRDLVGSLQKPGGPEVIPNVVLADEDYALIYRNAARGIPVALEFNIQNRLLEGNGMAYNTVGEIPGTGKRDEVVMLGGHLDSWHMGTGATDNAAGSVICLEAMRILKTIGVMPRRTIRVALWSGEETELLDQGYLGSSAYVQAHTDDLEKISVGLEVDNGTGRIRGIASELNPYAIPIFEQLFRPLRDLGVVAVQHRRNAGDCGPFDRKGVPCFNFIQDPIEYGTKTHHTNIDTYDALVLDDLKQAAVVMASTVYHLAMRDEMFPRKDAAVVSETVTDAPDIINIPEKELACLTGLYVDHTNIERRLDFFMEGGKLFYRAGPSVRRVSNLSQNRFKVVGAPVEMVFERSIAEGDMQMKVTGPGGTRIFVRSVTPTPSQLAEFTGKYVSDELPGEAYTLSINDGKLVMEAMGRKDILLTPAVADAFSIVGLIQWYRDFPNQLAIVKFTRNQKNAVSRFTLSMSPEGRTNLRFNKQ